MTTALIELIDGTRIAINDEINNENGTLLSVDTTCNLSDIRHSLPYGVISKNTSRIRISNTNGLLSKSNTKSPYYGKMNQAATLTLSRVSGGVTKIIARHSITSWSNGISIGGFTPITIVGADFLGTLLDRVPPAIEIRNSISYEAYIVELFKKLGYSNVVTHINIPHNLAYTHLEGATVGETLTKIANAIQGYIWEDTEGTIHIEQLEYLKSLPVLSTTLSGSTNITGGSILDNLYKASTLKVNYIRPTKKEKRELYKVDEVTIQSGESLEVLELGDGIYAIDSVNILNDKSKNASCLCTGIRYSKKATTLKLLNTTNEPQSVSLSIIGSDIILTKLYTESILDSMGSELEINNELIQTLDHANEYKARLLPYLNKELTAVQLECRLSEPLNIGDMVNVVLLKMGINAKGLIYEVVQEVKPLIKAKVTILLI